MKAYLVGGGLASLAAAVYLIKEAGVDGNDIYIYESRDQLGGALTAAGNADTGYIFPGSRVFEWQYRCAMDLFSIIPSASDPNKSIKQEIAEFNERYSWHDEARLVERGAKIAVPHLDLSFRQKFQFVKLILTPEALLQGKRIKDCVTPDFFKTNIWAIWSSIMAFVPEHSAIEMRRYFIRFLHLLPDLFAMSMILRTKYDQRQAIVEPICRWLSQHGVNFVTGAFVSIVNFEPNAAQLTAKALHVEISGARTKIDVRPSDVVMVTNGSQLADMSIGSMQSPPQPMTRAAGRSFALWTSLTRGRGDLGRPEVFTGDIKHSRWTSFTVTDKGALFCELMKQFSGREAGRGGLMTFKDSNWLITIVLFHQPDFIGQPKGTLIWWGYGIYPERPGDFVQKPMLECSGAEILNEVLMHLGFAQHADAIIASSVCIPCLLPYVSSVCLVRRKTDRPAVVPSGSANFACIGQFCEQPGDVAFTMEYSVRSAWTAVHTLCGKGRRPPPAYSGLRDPGALTRTLRALSKPRFFAFPIGDRNARRSAVLI
jgi:oleate hydratase